MAASMMFSEDIKAIASLAAENTPRDLPEFDGTQAGAYEILNVLLGTKNIRSFPLYKSVWD